MKRQLLAIALAAVATCALPAMAADEAGLTTTHTVSAIVAKVPEPTTVSLLMAGVVALGFARRRAAR